MLRIVCRETDCVEAANVGGPVHESLKTFDVNLPEVETWLTRWTQFDTDPTKARTNPYNRRVAIGVEVLAKEGK